MIEELFAELIVAVATKRKNDPKFEGLKYWQSIKKVTEGVDESTSVQWKPSNLPSDEVTKIMNLTEYTINGNIESKLNETNHYLIQTVRIPLTEQGNLRKVLQVAVNVGQLYVVWSLSEQYYISDHDLDRLTSYLDSTQIDKLNQFLEANPQLVTDIKSKLA
jgi:hypothetical protein